MRRELPEQAVIHPLRPQAVPLWAQMRQQVGSPLASPLSDEADLSHHAYTVPLRRGKPSRVSHLSSWRYACCRARATVPQAQRGRITHLQHCD